MDQYELNTQKRVVVNPSQQRRTILLVGCERPGVQGYRGTGAHTDPHSTNQRQGQQLISQLLNHLSLGKGQLIQAMNQHFPPYFLLLFGKGFHGFPTDVCKGGKVEVLQLPGVSSCHCNFQITKILTWHRSIHFWKVTWKHIEPICESV